ncbi:hypothetical protein C8T65DRAFT_700262 [Cerioporus squamosus]|nr:hypothetical protein C8T65DRAFT_700262 [Cerioporus squamosus]
MWHVHVCSETSGQRRRERHRQGMMQKRGLQRREGGTDRAETGETGAAETRRQWRLKGSGDERQARRGQGHSKKREGNHSGRNKGVGGRDEGGGDKTATERTVTEARGRTGDNHGRDVGSTDECGRPRTRMVRDSGDKGSEDEGAAEMVVEIRASWRRGWRWGEEDHGGRDKAKQAGATSCCGAERAVDGGGAPAPPVHSLQLLQHQCKRADEGAEEWTREQGDMMMVDERQERCGSTSALAVKVRLGLSHATLSLTTTTPSRAPHAAVKLDIAAQEESRCRMTDREPLTYIDLQYVPLNPIFAAKNTVTVFADSVKIFVPLSFSQLASSSCLKSEQLELIASRPPL